MKTFTTADIRAWNPCYDPKRHLADDWSGTVLDLLAIETIPAADRLWVVLREELNNKKTLRLFAVWCARQCSQTDARCIAAIDTAERYANGLATDAELSAAREAAWDAARSSAASYAARYAATYAAMYAAEDSARSAAEDAAMYAAMYAQLQKLVMMLTENSQTKQGTSC